MKRLALAAALLCAAPVPAAAIDLSLNGRYVTISGNVVPQDARRFLDAVQNRREPTTILFDSNGGYLAEAAWISQIIRARGWETWVMSGARCNSACPLMWLGGTARGLDSRLGFHTAIRLPVGSNIRHEEGNAFIGQFMRGMGAPQALVELQPKAEACCFSYVSHDKAEAWGLLGSQHIPARTEIEIQNWLTGLRAHMERQARSSGV